MSRPLILAGSRWIVLDKEGELAQMNVFQSYANYYDLIYQDKDYQAECDFFGVNFQQIF